MTNTNLIQERIAKIRTKGFEISPALETIILNEAEIAFNEGKRTALDALEKRQKLFDFIPVDEYGYKRVKASDLEVLSIINQDCIEKNKIPWGKDAKTESIIIADWFISQFQQYKALLLSQIEEVRKPNPTDSWVDTFEEITSWRPHDDLVRKQYGEVIRDVKSFISEVRQKAYDEGFEKGRAHGEEIANGEHHWD